MRRSVWAAAALLALAAGCGIPKEKHDAVLKDLEACKTTLASTRNALDRTSGERDTARKELAVLGGERSALAKRLGATKKELAALRKAREQAEARTRTFRQLLRRLRAMIDAGKLDVVVRKGRMVVKLSDKILFDPGRTRLKPEGRAALTLLAQALKDIGDRDFLVAGHTDNVPIRNRRYRSNWELSAARAVEVVKFLQGQGVDPQHLAAAGFSEYDPVGDNASAEGRRGNRRIEIILMPKLTELPRIDM